ncbi:hypothetical protein GCM10009663_31350 [Kitasatospora arboriphila]|uniref:Uncharacterized protein n=1 Tax=Kitasatospora arboriphila TaxID=258052 RepID=A0ABP4E4U0_9ACTN
MDTAGVDAEQDDVLGTLGTLHDLVGDPGDDPGDVGGVQHLVGRTRRSGSVCGHAEADLLPRLTGRVLKDVWDWRPAHRGRAHAISAAPTPWEGTVPFAVPAGQPAPRGQIGGLPPHYSHDCPIRLDATTSLYVTSQ